MRLSSHIPGEIRQVAETLESASFEAFLVGGCVRDLVMGRKPRDWDIATSATPDQILSLFKNAFYENDYGTVGVVNEEVQDETLRVVEVTPYRTEGKYSDRRRPDQVTFVKSIDEDLGRRDFTINALAYSISGDFIKDISGGLKDIKDMVVRAVGNPTMRFEEDALRLLRAIRIATELDFSIEKDTERAIRSGAKHIKLIAVERVRDEISKVIMSKKPMSGIELCHSLDILHYVIPELEHGIGMEQNGDHIYTVWEHNLRALQHAADRNWEFHVRLAAMLHDISKPETRRWSDEKNDWTFYGHDVVGRRISREILHRLKFSREMVDTVSKLVRYHLFFSDVEKITLSAVRRIVKNVGPEHVWDLMKVRACDRIGMGRPKETPYRLRKYEAMIEEAMRAPTSVGMLKIDGKGIMDVTCEKPGPRIGFILHALLEEVLDDPFLNTQEYLEKRALELAKLPDSDLKKLGEKGKEKKEEIEEKEIGEIRKRHWVK